MLKIILKVLCILAIFVIVCIVFRSMVDFLVYTYTSITNELANGLIGLTEVNIN